MLPHQKRVVFERESLAGNVERLATFTTSTTFAGLSHDERGLLYRQLGHMSSYLAILDERIAAFRVPR